MQNFFEALRSGKEPNCPFEVGFRVSIACRMAVESYLWPHLEDSHEVLPMLTDKGVDRGVAAAPASAPASNGSSPAARRQRQST